MNNLEICFNCKKTIEWPYTIVDIPFVGTNGSRYCFCKECTESLILKEELLEALPEEMFEWDEWAAGYNCCLKEITHIIEKFGKDEGEDEV